VSLSRESFVRVQKLVLEQTAIVLDESKEYLVESRLAPLARAHGFADVEALCGKLPSRSDLRAAVVDAMTTNETSFFRDQHPFEALRTQVLPELIAQRERPRKLRIWCAACSTGQEPYSVAMLLEELGPKLAGWDITIDATDVSRSVIARAKAGRYSQLEVDRGLNQTLLARHFYRDKNEWEVRPELKRRVNFSELNLVGQWPRMQRYDIIFLRNVLIYFDAQTKRTILERVQQCAVQDGFLVLGGSETLPHGFTSYERLPITRAGIYRVRALRPSAVSTR
jgi:chemotaxis protein methyltransferase CheR